MSPCQNNANLSRCSRTTVQTSLNLEKCCKGVSKAFLGLNFSNAASYAPTDPADTWTMAQTHTMNIDVVQEKISPMQVNGTEGKIKRSHTLSCSPMQTLMKLWISTKTANQNILCLPCIKSQIIRPQIRWQPTLLSSRSGNLENFDSCRAREVWWRACSTDHKLPCLHIGTVGNHRPYGVKR